MPPLPLTHRERETADISDQVEANNIAYRLPPLEVLVIHKASFRGQNKHLPRALHSLSVVLTE